MNEVEKLKKEYQEILNESREVARHYYDDKLHSWRRGGFNVTDWTYYREFWGKADYEEWENYSVTSYLNFLSSRLKNIEIKLNQIKMREFGRH